MALSLLGINHRTAPIELREQIAFDQHQLPKLLGSFCQIDSTEEALILSTCNRTEIYYTASRDCTSEIHEWLRKHTPRANEVISSLYQKADNDVVTHACRVAGGLDSLVLGEPQIFGQLKLSHRQAQEAGTLGPALHRLFRHAFEVAKQIRTETAIGQASVSAATVAIGLAQQVFDGFADKTALMIGAGEMIEIAAEHLRARQIGTQIIANRSFDRGQNLAKKLNCRAITLDQISDVLPRCDMVFSSTASPDTILKKSMVDEALSARKRRPLFIVDLAVPRDVDAAVAKLKDVYLYTIDDLHQAIDDNLEARNVAAGQAETIIRQRFSDYERTQDGLGAVPLIKSLRNHGDELKQDVLLQARRQLDAGKDPHEVIDWVAGALTKKLLHHPSTQLRSAAEQSDAEFLDSVRRLFDLSDD